MFATGWWSNDWRPCCQRPAVQWWVLIFFLWEPRELCEGPHLHRFAEPRLPSIPGSTTPGWGAKLASRLVLFGKQPGSPTLAILAMDSTTTLSVTLAGHSRGGSAPHSPTVHQTMAAQLLLRISLPLQAGCLIGPADPPRCSPLPHPSWKGLGNLAFARSHVQ